MSDELVRQALADLSRCASVFMYFSDTGDGDVDKAHDDLVESLARADQLLAGDPVAEPAVSMRPAGAQASRPAVTAAGRLRPHSSQGSPGSARSQRA